MLPPAPTQLVPLEKILCPRRAALRELSRRVHVCPSTSRPAPARISLFMRTRLAGTDLHLSEINFIQMFAGFWGFGGHLVAPSALEPAAGGAPSATGGALPPGWFAADAGGVTYYYTASGQRQWEPPTSPAPAVGPPQQAPVVAAGEDTGPADGDGAGWLGSLGGWFR